MIPTLWRNPKEHYVMFKVKLCLNSKGSPLSDPGPLLFFLSLIGLLVLVLNFSNASPSLCSRPHSLHFLFLHRLRAALSDNMINFPLASTSTKEVQLTKREVVDWDKCSEQLSRWFNGQFEHLHGSSMQWSSHRNLNGIIDTASKLSLPETQSMVHCPLNKYNNY